MVPDIAWFSIRGDLELPHLDVLDVPDDFEVMDPKLHEMLKATLDLEIDYLLSSL
jgi:predicted protein tyrosine phosphatase